MDTTNNYNCVPMYASIQERDRIGSRGYGELPHLYCDQWLLPFQVSVPVMEGKPLSHFRVEVYDSEGTQIGHKEAWVEEHSQQIIKRNDIDGKAYGIYLADRSQSPIISVFDSEEDYFAGKCYIVASLYFGSGQYEVIDFYSDWLTVLPPHLAENATKIEWTNIEDLAVGAHDKVIYSLGNYFQTDEPIQYINRLFFLEPIGCPEYKTEEEGEERGGFFFAETQVSEKQYKLRIPTTEPTCDVMRLIQLADAVRVIDELGRTYSVDRFEMSVNWSDGGMISNTICTFETAQIVRKTAQGYNIESGRGDFNHDYNNDYLITVDNA